MCAARGMLFGCLLEKKIPCWTHRTGKHTESDSSSAIGSVGIRSKNPRSFLFLFFIPEPKATLKSPRAGRTLASLSVEPASAVSFGEHWTTHAAVTSFSWGFPTYNTGTNGSALCAVWRFAALDKERSHRGHPLRLCICRSTAAPATAVAWWRLHCDWNAFVRDCFYI